MTQQQYRKLAERVSALEQLLRGVSGTIHIINVENQAGALTRDRLDVLLSNISDDINRRLR